MIAALFVETDGVYFGLEGVEPFDQLRDARTYNGDWPVVAHPPCARWGSFWYGGLLNHKKGIRFQKGDDGGCFKSAFETVNRVGGVIEHPRGTHAWKHFGIPRPKNEGWLKVRENAWTCQVWQGSYGHPAYKPTWLYYVGPEPQQLRWGKPAGEFRPVCGASFKSKEHRAEMILKGWKYTPRILDKLRMATPVEFRDLLIKLAKESVHAVKG